MLRDMGYSKSVVIHLFTFIGLLNHHQYYCHLIMKGELDHGLIYGVQFII